MNSTVSNFILLNSFNSLLFFIIENKGNYLDLLKFFDNLENVKRVYLTRILRFKFKRICVTDI